MSDGIRIELTSRHDRSGYVIATVPVEGEYVFPMRLAVGDYRRVSAGGELPEAWKAWLWPSPGGAMHVTRSAAAAERPTKELLLETLQQRARKAPWWEQAAREAAASPYPGTAADINWELLKGLYGKPHDLINDPNTDGLETSGRTVDGLHYGVVELWLEAKAVHHLLDMIGVPHGYGMDTRGIDSRTLIAVTGMLAVRERLDRISARHCRETGPGGTVGDQCFECGQRWPCDTRRMADGTCTEEEDGE